MNLITSRQYLASLPHRQTFQLAWPMILSNISAPLMTLADSAMLGHHNSAIHLGAVAIGGNIIALVFWMFSFLRAGTTALVGQSVGANNQRAEFIHVLQNGVIALCAGLLVMSLQFLLIPFAVNAMVPSPELRQLAAEYSSIRVFAAAAVFLNYVLIGWFIGRQNTLIPLCVTISANLLNVVLDYWFIVLLDQGSAGAAKASLMAEVCACGLSLLFAAPHFASMLRSSRPDFKQLKSGWKGTAKLNIHLVIRTTILLLVFNFFTAQGANLGPATLAANALLMQLALGVSFALDGYAHAIESLVAHAVGANNYEQMLKACAAATFAGLLIACGLSVTFAVFGSNMINMLTNQTDTLKTATQHLIWLQILPLVSVWCYMLDGVFIGAGQTRLMRNTMLVASLGVFLPAWWLLKFTGNHGLWAAFTLFNGFRGLSLGWIFFRFHREKMWHASQKDNN